MCIRDSASGGRGISFWVGGTLGNVTDVHHYSPPEFAGDPKRNISTADPAKALVLGEYGAEEAGAADTWMVVQLISHLLGVVAAAVAARAEEVAVAVAVAALAAAPEIGAEAAAQT